MRRSGRSVVCYALVALLLPRPIHAEPAATPDRDWRTAFVQDAAALGVGRLVHDVALEPLDGASRQLSALVTDSQGVVIAMTSAGCPLSGRYGPRLAALEARYAPRGVRFVFVNASPTESREEIDAQRREAGFVGTYIHDVDGLITAALGARTTTEVLVLDAGRTLVYRGAVDDQYGVGIARAEASRRFLVDALDAMLESRPFAVRATWPPGCLLEAAAPAEARPSDVTYYARVARIIDQRCVQCHHRGGAGPFPLDLYEHVVARAPMIEAVVRAGLMPPWHGDVSGGAVWANDRLLTEAEREDLLNWLRSGMPAGQPADAPPRREEPSTWRIGPPDALVSASARIPGGGGALHHARLIVPMVHEEDQWISAIEMRPVKQGSVHHALVWLLGPRDHVPEPDAMPTHLPLLAAYSPGDDLLRYPTNAGRRLPVGSRLLVDLYSRPMERETVARLRVAMRFASSAPALEVRSLVVAADAFSIEPDEGASPLSCEVRLASDLSVLSITPYMRACGRATRLEAQPPEGAARVLLNAPRYDFRWQIRHEFTVPPRLSAGTVLALKGMFDNAESNPNRPGPGLAVGCGPGAAQEAFLVALDCVSPRGP